MEVGASLENPLRGLALLVKLLRGRPPGVWPGDFAFDGLDGPSEHDDAANLGVPDPNLLGPPLRLAVEPTALLPGSQDRFRLVLKL